MRGRATVALAVLLALPGAGSGLAQDAVPGLAPPQPVPVTPAPALVPASPGATSAAPATVTAAPEGMGAAALLTVDQNALYTESLWGKRALAELEARRVEVLAENDRIAAALEAEDDALTALRPTLAPDEFRRRADAFDTRVQQVRQQREQAGNALIEAADADRAAFLNAALPVLNAVMRERGATVILDRRTVFIASDAVDATALLISRIDSELGAGSTLPPTATQPQVPDPQPAPQPAPQP